MGQFFTEILVDTHIDGINDVKPYGMYAIYAEMEKTYKIALAKLRA